MTPLPLRAGAPLATTLEVEKLLSADAPVAVGVSGGKDSCAVALVAAEHLDAMGHAGPRLLIHADLGVTEWKDSLPTCRRLADRLGWELAVVKRPQGDMMDRWEQRWRDNVARWLALSCVKLILPWSTPAMRFCTAELKVDQITRHLVRRFPRGGILNVTGVRRGESRERANVPVSKANPKLTSVTQATYGIDWLPLADWTTDEVYGFLADRAFPLHEAYTAYGARRVSCVYCILATKDDHLVAVRALENLPVARRMVELEVASTFAFQGDRWLGDTLAGVLPDLVTAVQAAKRRAALRQEAEALIPKHLLYTKGWPTCVPTPAEAGTLAGVRRVVAAAVGLEPTFTDPDQIRFRYEELMRLKSQKKPRKR